MKAKSVLRLITAIVISSMLFSSGIVQAATVIPQEGEPNDEELIPVDKLPKELELGREVDDRRIYNQRETALDRSSTEDRSTGGPDDFGYTWDDTEPYSWIDAKTLGSNIGVYGGDNYTSSPVPIGFSFPFYGENHTDVYITTEGLIDFFGPGLWYLNTSIPSTGEPDNFIAPYWADLGMYNNGNRPEAGIYVYQGGIAPERYFVVEWYQADNWYSYEYGAETANLTFQVILFESGEMVFQYQQLEGNLYSPSIGIEDPTGTDGLEYGDFPYDGLAIRFSTPEPSYRVKLRSEQASGFVGSDTINDYDITLTNTGALGTDSYSLSVDGIHPDSGWTFELLETDGVTPVTGPITLSQGESSELIGRLSVSEGHGIGDSIVFSITATSVNDPTASKTIQNKYVIPAPFVQVLYDLSDGASSAYMVTPNSQQKYVIPGSYGSDGMAVIELPNRNQIHLCTYTVYMYESDMFLSMIRYWIVDRYGNVIKQPEILSDLTSASVETRDIDIAVDVNSNGDIGITWLRSRYKVDNGSRTYNTNIHYMVLNQDGSIKIPRTNLTSDWTWYQSGDGYVSLNSPKIAATDNGNFTIVWEKYTLLDYDTYVSKTDIYQAVVDNAGNTVKNITKLTNAGPAGEFYIEFVDPALTKIDENNVFMAWRRQVLEPSGDGPWMWIIDSSLESSVYLDNGNLLSPVSTVEDFFNWRPDVTQLSDGTIMLAADGHDEIVVQLYDGTSYNPAGGSVYLYVPLEDQTEKEISVTHDNNGHGIITWGMGYENQDHLGYALINSDGNILTEPMAYYQAGSSVIGNIVYASVSGHGVTTYTYSYPPEFTSTPIEDAIADLPYSYAITATDADLPGDSLTFVEVGLPDWLDLTDYGDGTALLSGTPSSLDIGEYELEIVVEDSYRMTATQTFTITVQASEAPAFTSADSVIFTEGVAGTFTVETSGAPDPAIGLSSGSLPTGVSFLDNGDGTATISGTPAVGTTGSDYPLTLSATNGIAPDASQNFTLTVGTPPEFDSGDSSSGVATVGECVELYETVSSYPENPIITLSGDLPAGLTFLDLGMGTAVISGTPEVGTGGIYPLTMTADNGTAENDTLEYTLTVKTVETIGAEGGTISSNGGAASITVPSGSLSEELSFEFIPLEEPTEGVPSSLAFAGTSFQLIARNGDEIVHPTFDPPLVVEIHYDESDLGDMPEDELILYYWDTDTLAWLDAAETCTSGAGYTYYPESDYFTVEICHLTEFSVMGEGGVDVFLPLIVK